jgi:hypothetical protein
MTPEGRQLETQIRRLETTSTLAYLPWTLTPIADRQRTGNEAGRGAAITSQETSVLAQIGSEILGWEARNWSNRHNHRAQSSRHVNKIDSDEQVLFASLFGKVT